MSITDVWRWLDNVKVIAVQLGFNEQQLIATKVACDALFKAAGGGDVCPAWWIGGWR